MQAYEELIKIIKKQQKTLDEVTNLLEASRSNPSLLFGDGVLGNLTMPPDVQNGIAAVIPTGGVIMWAAADPAMYTVQTPPAGFLLCDGASYPNNQYPSLASTIFNTYGYGTGKTFTANASTDVITCAGHGYTDDDIVYLTTDGALPSGLTYGKLYYVVSATTNTFKLSLLASGSPIDITDAGTSTHYVYSTFLVPNLAGRLPLGLKTLDAEYPTMGATGGEKTHQLTIAELAAHDHGLAAAGAFGNTGGAEYHLGTGRTVVSESVGSGTAHNNMPPYLVVSFIIKT